MTDYVVTAPYIVPRVKDANGAWVVQGLYRDARIAEADIDPESLRHHVDGGMLAPVDEPVPAPAPPAKAASSKAKSG